MGWLGRKSIETAVTVFDDFVSSAQYDSAIVKHTLTTQVEALRSSLPFVRKDTFINTIKEEFYSYAATIRKPDANLMAKNTINMGIKLKDMTGDENIYYAHLLMGSFYQCISETNSLQVNMNSRKYLKSAGLMAKVIERISSVLEEVHVG